MGGRNPQHDGRQDDGKTPKDAKGGPKSAPSEKTGGKPAQRPR
jgi:hypothetical protein